VIRETKKEIQVKLSARVVINIIRTTTLLVAPLFCGQSAGAATETEKIIYTFTGGANGAHPYSELLLDKAGNLFGTTSSGGGIGVCNGLPGCGTVFELSPSSSGWTEKTIYTFTGSADGGFPLGGVVMDKSGNLYGTAQGAGGASYCGTVIELTPSAEGEWTETTLYSFNGYNEGGDGCSPRATLTLDANGNIYGTTGSGGPFNDGTVFELLPPSAPGGAWTETVLLSFDGTDGDTPTGSVVFDNAGNLYGTTDSGGSFNWGSVFKLTPTSGSWSATSIFSFTSGDNGCNPNGGVVFDKAGNLYGTTDWCGADEVGTVFKLTPTVGQWTMSRLHTFTGAIDGAEPYAGLTLDPQGNIYGATFLGGLFGEGVAFKLTRKSGKWAESEYSFRGGADGTNPYAAPTLGQAALFGTTVYGGAATMGTVYMITSGTPTAP
jgi:uncharacterized repeat protein (TIGR03803 family)